eukprot:TRINITY_DN2772_c0_g1_i5.p2 TRINITY_DN2772_c0_g1~~TRINITY_DN2772_c0_g1_i5.p2  ORF type:complete len:107 (-),score=1.79 TRINITY_DN2772_c0_g1_i5:21-341(-)
MTTIYLLVQSNIKGKKQKHAMQIIVSCHVQLLGRTHKCLPEALAKALAVAVAVTVAGNFFGSTTTTGAFLGVATTTSGFFSGITTTFLLASGLSQYPHFFRYFSPT